MTINDDNEIITYNELYKSYYNINKYNEILKFIYNDELLKKELYESEYKKQFEFLYNLSIKIININEQQHTNNEFYDNIKDLSLYKIQEIINDDNTDNDTFQMLILYNDLFLDINNVLINNF
jgi:hypothetical protein